ncbi:major facilitator superfamily domain-containing protein [Lipomyces kononenkoae]
MGIFQAGLLVPVAVEPVIGGALAESLGWRAIFWFLTIYSGLFLLSMVANGSRIPTNPLRRYALNIYLMTTRVKWDPDAISLQLAARKSIDQACRSHHHIPRHLIYYAVWQMSITAMSTLFKERYGLDEIQIGPTFIANGAGSMIGTLVTRKNSRYGLPAHHIPIEKARLRLVPVFSLLQCLSITLFGWTIQYPDHGHIAVPIVFTFITGWTAVLTQSVIITYLVDIFPNRSAAASASLNLARCLFAAGGTSTVMPMINRTGVGLAFTICQTLVDKKIQISNIS